MTAKRIVALLSIIALLILLYLPIFRWLIQSWLSSLYYTHGFLIPVVSGVIIWMKRDKFKGAKPSNMGAGVVALGLLVYIVGFVWGMTFVAALSLIPVLGGLVLYSYGSKAMMSLAFPLGFLVFMIPLPFSNDLAYRLQSLSVYYSASLLHTMGLPITTSGSTILLRDTAFWIGLPCSGMRTLISLLALAAVLAYVLAGAPYKRATVLMIAFPIAVLANILRISSLIAVANYYGTEAATGLAHGFSSLLFFVAAFLGVAAWGRFLGCRLRVTW